MIMCPIMEFAHAQKGTLLSMAHRSLMGWLIVYAFGLFVGLGGMRVGRAAIGWWVVVRWSSW
jgi:hypothetical protein